MSNPKRTAVAIATPIVLITFAPQQSRAAQFELVEATVAEINQAFDAGALTSKQLVQIYLNRIEAYDEQGSSLNSLITINPDALEQAAALDAERQTAGPRSPLHGIPVIVKDNYDTFDLPTTAGSLALENSVPPNDAFIVDQLRDAGAIVLAKSNLAEFAFLGSNTLISIGGQTLNPDDLERVPAGSSGGTGAAIAANFGTIGLGTDTGISIRGPSSANNLVGLRPTIGLTSRDGIVPLNLNRDVGGPMTRTVEDAAKTLDIIAGFNPDDPSTAASIGNIPDSYTDFLDPNGLEGARVGVLRELLETDLRETTPEFVRGVADSDVVALANRAIQDIEMLGAEVIDPVSIPNLFELNEASGGCSRFRFDLNNYLDSLGSDAPVNSLKEIVDSGNFAPFAESGLRSSQAVELSPNENPDCAEAEAGKQIFRETVLSVMEEFELDAFVYPSFKNQPRLIGDTDSPYGSVSSIIAPPIGFPAITVPMGLTSDGLPVGIQFLARSFEEPTLFELAYAYEQGTQLRTPPALFPSLPGEVK